MGSHTSSRPFLFAWESCPPNPDTKNPDHHSWGRFQGAGPGNWLKSSMLLPPPHRRAHFFSGRAAHLLTSPSPSPSATGPSKMEIGWPGPCSRRFLSCPILRNRKLSHLMRELGSAKNDVIFTLTVRLMCNYGSNEFTLIWVKIPVDRSLEAEIIVIR